MAAKGPSLLPRPGRAIAAMAAPTGHASKCGSAIRLETSHDRLVLPDYVTATEQKSPAEAGLS